MEYPCWSALKQQLERLFEDNSPVTPIVPFLNGVLRK